MFEIHPDIASIYSCPQCGELLVISQFIINGIRSWVDASCERCERGYYIEMPTGTGLYYPTTIDKARRRNQYKGEVRIEVERFTEHSQIVLVNCLDGCYGDCLLKLFNAQYYLDHCPHLGVVVLVPKPIAFFVPDGVAEVWTTNVPIRACGQWNVSLGEQVGELIREKKKVYLSVTYPHAHPSYYDIDRFVKAGVSDLSKLGSPVVVFGYRADRTWGSDQHRNIQEMYNNLKRIFPEMSFVVIGLGQSGQFTDGILDKRVVSPNAEQEQYWIDLLRHTDCFVGVHGSNMIVGSGLAKFTIELLPQNRYGNFGQTIIARPNEKDWRTNLFRFRVLHGKDDLADILPCRVAAVALSQLGKGETYEMMMGIAHQPHEIIDPKFLLCMREEHIAGWARWSEHRKRCGW